MRFFSSGHNSPKLLTCPSFAEKNCLNGAETVKYKLSIAEIHQLPIEEKLQIMEALWEDLRIRFERMEISQAHETLLDERRARVQNGTAKLLDWDAVKSTIGRA